MQSVTLLLFQRRVSFITQLSGKPLPAAKNSKSEEQ